MTNTETDRIQNAIRHIQTAVDVDPWAMKIAVDAMDKQIPKETILKPAGLLGNIVTYSKHCPECDHEIFAEKYCSHCGQKIYWWED